MIFVNDHGPPHVHVVGAAGEAKIILSNPAGPELEWVVGTRAFSAEVETGSAQKNATKLKI